MKRLTTAFTFFLVLGCATKGYRITEQNLSLGDVKRSIVAVIGDPRVLSENQRTFYSQYFSRKPDPKFDPQKARERAYSKVVILGERRPYDVDIEVIIETRNSQGFVQSGTDMSEAKRVGKEIRAKLNLSREDRNVIDDFRAF